MSVPFYGRQPEAAEVPQIQAPLLLHYAEVDERDALPGQGGLHVVGEHVLEDDEAIAVRHVLELAAKRLAHLLYTARHCTEVVFPLSKELGVVEDGRGDTGAVGGRI